MSLLTEGIARLGLPCTGELSGLLESYLEELELWNGRMNLVGASGDALIVKHLLDSLSGVRFIQELPHSTVADIGSGAGFPGVPLAVYITDARFSLVERSAKRATFLRNVVALLGLRDRVAVVERDVGELNERFAVVTFRAFREFADFAPALFAATGEGGAVVSFKGRRSTAEQELAAIGESVDSWRCFPVTVPWLNEERTIVVIRPRSRASATRSSV